MTTMPEQNSIPEEAWENTVDGICQALRGYSLQHGVSLDTLMSLLMVDLCKLSGLRPSPASTRQRGAPPNGIGPWRLSICARIIGLVPDFVIYVTETPTNDARIMTSLVSSHKLETWLEQHGSKAPMTVDALRQFEVLVTKDKPGEQVLKKGANNQDTSDNHRVRADFPEGKDYASIDIRVIENSDKRLKANNKYQLLVVLIRKLDGQPVGYALSNRFQVTTTRALSGWNALIPCWDTPVHKLDGCRERTQINLQNVRKCACKKGQYTPPAEGINQVNTAEEFLQLLREMKSWVGVPRAVRTALRPEATVKHAEKMLLRDFQMRIFWPKHSQYGAMYLCHQGHVDLADGSSDVLMTYNPFRDAIAGHATVRITLPEGRDAEQNEKMTQLARTRKWPGSRRGIVTARPSADPQLSLSGQPKEQAPLPPQPHNQPGAAPSSSLGAGLMLGDDSFLHAAGQSPSNSAASFGTPEAGFEDIWDSPPLSSNQDGQQAVRYKPCRSAQDHIHSTFPNPNAANPDTPPPTFPDLNNQGSPNHSSSTSPSEVPCLPYSALIPTGSTQLGPAPLGAPAGQGWPGCQQHISPPAGMLQLQPPSAASCMQQHVQALEGMRLGSGQGLLARPLSPASGFGPAAVTDQRLSPSHAERVRPRQLDHSTRLAQRAAESDGLGEQEQQIAGQNEVEEIQPHVTHVASDFLPTIRARAVRTQLCQLGAAAQSPALEGWRRALLAIFAHRRPLWVDDPVARGDGDDEMICNIIITV